MTTILVPKWETRVVTGVHFSLALGSYLCVLLSLVRESDGTSPHVPTCISRRESRHYAGS